MKLFDFLLVIAVSLPLMAAAEPPTGVAEIPWGATPDEAAQVLTGKGATVTPAEPVPGKETSVTATGGTFADHPVESWTFLFYEGKFYSASLRLVSDMPKELLRDLKQLFVAKYGPATKEGHGFAEWRFTPTLKVREAKFCGLKSGDLAAAPPVAAKSWVDVTYTNAIVKAPVSPATPPTVPASKRSQTPPKAPTDERKKGV